MTISIELESLSPQLIYETEEIINDNYKETAHFHEPLDIDWDVYFTFGENFKAFVMRDENYKVVGVLFYATAKYPHIKSLNMAQQLTFYVDPMFRKYSLKLLKISEDYFKGLGIDIMIQSARYNSSFCDVLNAKGYEKADITFIKRLN